MKDSKKNGLMIVGWLVLLMTGCGQQKETSLKYSEEINQWRSERLARLKSKNGWLNLEGIYWLKNGMNTFGSDSSNMIVFPPGAPTFIGEIELKGDSVYLRNTFRPVLIDSVEATHARLNDDVSGKPDLMTLDSYAWLIIKRGSRYAIRLRDYNSPLIDSLDNIPCFETDESYKITADFIPYPKPEKHKVQTILGTEEESLVPGELHFRLRGRKRIIYPFEGDGSLFLVFGDKTNGNETYPAGRFLYTDLPDKDNHVIIDFNKAYNPPCAFTPYATCPLPIKKNIIPARIAAGEKEVHILTGH
jgi:uncharacterized protein (DUF1684 family)